MLYMIKKFVTPHGDAEMNIPEPASLSILYDDLVTEILSQLPVKSLVRFRCVCKSWKSLFSDSTFMKLQLERSAKYANILFYHDSFPLEGNNPFPVTCVLRSLLQDPSPTGTEYSFSSESKLSPYIVGSCNGLVCVRIIRFVNREFHDLAVRLWNPAMRFKSKSSPRLRAPVRVLNGVSASSARFGFGYDHSSGCYKVVAVLLGSKKMKVNVYCVGDSSWRKIVILPSFPILCKIDGVFVSGTVNWLSLHGSGYKYDWRTVNVKQLAIFSLDLGNYTFKRLSLPQGIRELPIAEPQLTILRDCLCLFHDYKQTHFLLWQMKVFGDEKSWTPLVLLDDARYMIPLLLSDNGDMVLFSNIHDKEVPCHQKYIKRLHVISIEGYYTRLRMNAIRYVPSMVLPC